MKKKFKLGKKKSSGSNFSKKWVLQIIFLTFFVSGGLSLISEVLLRNVQVLVAFIILITIVMIGIIFDIIGVAVTAADETPFHSMSSKKVIGAKTSINMVRNASKISNFCNDVVGDICSILSGAAGAVIIAKLSLSYSPYASTISSIILSATIAALTVGGKAIGKYIAINQSTSIIYELGYIAEELGKLVKIK
ncbi:MAG TPA: hypothetical protein DD429_01945 [Clostridiaceae bacterium]|nr:hypothetical protein [Clostridiaceae bacterium]